MRDVHRRRPFSAGGIAACQQRNHRIALSKRGLQKGQLLRRQLCPLSAARLASEKNWLAASRAAA